MTIENRGARHEYFVTDSYEFGIALLGNEVKSVRDGKATIKGSWATIENGELYIKGMHITAWATSNAYDVDEKRNKKLLAHKREITKLSSVVKLKGYTLIPLKVYFNERGRCKVLIGVCTGKKDYDKRESAKKADAGREIAREMRKAFKD